MSVRTKWISYMEDEKDKRICDENKINKLVASIKTCMKE